MLRGAVAGENIDEFAFGFGDNAFVLLLSDLKTKVQRAGRIRNCSSAKRTKANLFCLVVGYGADRLACNNADATWPVIA